MVLATQDRESGLWVPGYWRSEAERDRPPSLDELQVLFRDGRQYFSQFHRQCGLEESYYGGLRSIPVPRNIDPVWPATAAGIVNVATDHVDINNLSIDVPSAPRARARAERIKKFYQGAWLSVKKPVLKTVTRHAFLYGIGWTRTQFKADEWPAAPTLEHFDGDEAAYKEALREFQDLRAIKWPLHVDVIKPTNLIWDDSRSGSRWAVEFYERPVKDLAWRYPEWARSKDVSAIASLYMYWDSVWCAFVADNELLFPPMKHNYGFMPFEPLLPVHTHTFADGQPEERYRGILYPVHSLLDEEARLLTQIGALVRQVSYRTLDFKGPRMQAEEVAEDYEIFGGKNIVTPSVEVGVSPMVQIPPDIGDQLARVQNKIEEATFPNVVRGVRPRGVSAGFGISVLAGMGRIVFQGVADGLRHMIEGVNSRFAMLVENKVRGRVTVHARSDVHNFDQTIEPDDIRGLIENSVIVKAEAPEERERESLLALRLWNGGNGLITKYEAQKRAGIANPLEEQMLQKAERIADSDPVTQLQIQQLMERIGLPMQQMQAVSGQVGAPGAQLGSQNVGGAQLPRPGETNIQQARVAANQGEPSVYPEGMGGVDILGRLLGGSPGGAQGMPSGQTVRR